MSTNAQKVAWRNRGRNRERECQYIKEWNKKNPLKYMLNTAKRRVNDARRKNVHIEFTITESDFPVLPTHCPVLGLELHYGGGRGGRMGNSASLDRRDNSKGYIPGNVDIVSWRANNLKGDASLEELEAVVAYMRG